ncbi:MAG: four helix bundle protein [gamma proteobacterium symbiont of Taylorina sp.]|nr:four helix bundle protein [gamma proteobacterium symbiont of Taylorina sp.]
MNFEDTESWKRSSRLCVEIYRAFAKHRDYAFKDQITRSALSIPSNIAEGLERQSDKETIQFLNYARGSSAELRTQIYIGIEIGYIQKRTGLAWVQESKELSAMIMSLIKYLKISR